MLTYCRLNRIIPQSNGSDDDCLPLSFKKTLLYNVENIQFQGSHLTVHHCQMRATYTLKTLSLLNRVLQFSPLDQGCTVQSHDQGIEIMCLCYEQSLI